MAVSYSVKFDTSYTDKSDNNRAITKTQVLVMASRAMGSIHYTHRQKKLRKVLLAFLAVRFQRLG
jgi:hypothetical protein